MNDESSLHCPVCQVRFRGERECSRCGADLNPLMLLAVQAHILRQAAQQSLRSGDARTALASVQAAQDLRSTPRGDLLQFACAIASNGLCESQQGSGSGPRRSRPNGLSKHIAPHNEQGSMSSFGSSEDARKR